MWWRVILIDWNPTTALRMFRKRCSTVQSHPQLSTTEKSRTCVFSSWTQKNLREWHCEYDQLTSAIFNPALTRFQFDSAMLFWILNSIHQLFETGNLHWQHLNVGSLEYIIRSTPLILLAEIHALSSDLYMKYIRGKCWISRNGTVSKRQGLSLREWVSMPRMWSFQS